MALRGHVAPVFAMRISRDGDLLFSASADHSMKVWDLRSGECAHTLQERDLPISSLALDLQARSVYAGYSGRHHMQLTAPEPSRLSPRCRRWCLYGLGPHGRQDALEYAAA